MTHRRFFFTGLAALVGVAALLALRAGGQVSPDTAKTPPTIVEIGPDNVLVERTFDGKFQRVTKQEPNAAQNPAGQIEYRYEQYDEKGPDGSVERRTFVVPVQKGGRTQYAPAANVAIGYGATSPYTPDPESQKLMAEEQALAQSVRQLASEAQKSASTGEPSDAKAVLRQKLVQIFDLQQQRRTHEIAKIEERLGKLKETLKKRDTSKDSIIDRRLETITGGVDELGWEESFPTLTTPYGHVTPGRQPMSTVPRFGLEPQAAPLSDPTPYPPPATAPVPPSAEPRFAPPPVAPRAGIVPSPVPPAPAGDPVAPRVPPAPAPPSATTVPPGATPAAEPPAVLPVPSRR
jgi:hypothetical protein